MVESRKVLAIAVVSLLLATVAGTQIAPVAEGQTGPGGGSPGASGRGTVRATQPAMDSTLMAGVVRLLRAGAVNMYLVVGKEKALLIDTGNPGHILCERRAIDGVRIG